MLFKNEVQPFLTDPIFFGGGWDAALASRRCWPKIDLALNFRKLVFYAFVTGQRLENAGESPLFLTKLLEVFASLFIRGLWRNMKGLRILQQLSQHRLGFWSPTTELSDGLMQRRCQRKCQRRKYVVPAHRGTLHSARSFTPIFSISGRSRSTSCWIYPAVTSPLGRL